MIRLPAIICALALCCLTAQAALWTPAYLPATTNALWLDASDATSLRLRGSSVTNWLDKSGNNRTFAQTVASNQPAYTPGGLNGLSVLSFTNSYLTSTNPRSTWKFLHDGTRVSMFSVVKTWTNAAQTNVGSFGLWGTVQVSASTGSYVVADDRYAQGRTNTIIHVAFGGTAQASITHVSNPNVWSSGQYRLLFIASDPGNSTATNRSIIRANGTTIAQANTFTNAPKTGDPLFSLDIGTIGGGHAARLVGGFAEIVFLTGTTNDVDRQQVEGYLAWKWGLQGSLPASHQYKSAAPTVPDAPTTIAARYFYRPNLIMRPNAAVKNQESPQ